MHANYADLRAMMGRVLGVLGVACAAVGLFLINGISIEFPGIVLGGLGYYFCLTGDDDVGKTLGIAAAALCAVSIAVSGLDYPLQL